MAKASENKQLDTTVSVQPGDRLVADALDARGAGSLTLEQILDKIGELTPESVDARFSQPILLQLYEVTGGGRLPFETTSFKPDDLSSKEVRDLLETHVLPVQKRRSTSFATMVTLGRAPNCDIVVPVPLVSKFHLWFSQTHEGWVVSDAGSTNGTSVDGTPLEARRPRPLAGPTILSLASEYHFRFVPASEIFPLLRAADRLR